MADDTSIFTTTTKNKNERVNILNNNLLLMFEWTL